MKKPKREELECEKQGDAEWRITLHPFLGEGTDEYAVSLCFPHYCPCCGAKVVSE